MCKVNISSPQFNIEMDLKPSADMFDCLFQGIVAALPAFLEAFMKCLSDTPGTGGYSPGNRHRCD